jgi:hypothetical protein
VTRLARVGRPAAPRPRDPRPIRRRCHDDGLDARASEREGQGAHKLGDLPR